MLVQNILRSKRNSFIYLLSLCLLFACGNSEKKPDETPPKEVKTKVKKTPKKLSLGERAFIYCQACHNVKKGDPHKVGPNLHGLFGLKAGIKEGYQYSEALKNSKIVWDENHLRNWLEKPTDYIPGTTMAFIGIEDKEQQTALIEYLKEVTK